MSQDAQAQAVNFRAPQANLPDADPPGVSGKGNRPTRRATAAARAAGKENSPATIKPAHLPNDTKMTEILHNHLTCPICQEWLLACHTLSCGHMFCGLCLATWLSQKPSCPSCRKAVAGKLTITRHDAQSRMYHHPAFRSSIFGSSDGC